MDELDEQAYLRRTRLVSRELDRRAWVVLLIGMAVMGGLVLYLSRDATFSRDEWMFIQYRRGWNVDAIFQPHNQHVYLFAVIVYKLCFGLFGLSSYLPYQLAGIVFQMLAVGLFFEVARKRIGNLLALGMGLSLLTLGSASPDLLWPFQMGFFGSMIFGLLAVLLLEKDHWRADIGACLCLIFSIASFSFGLIFAISATVVILWRDDRWRRLWITGVPVALFVIWERAFGMSNFKFENLLAAPAYMADQLSSGFGGILGLGIEYGRPVLFLAVGVTLVAIAKSEFAGPRIAGWLVALLGLLCLTALARAELGDPTATRYVYFDVLLIFLVATEVGVLVFGVGGAAAFTGNWSRVTKEQATFLLALGLFGVLAVGANLNQLRSGAAKQRSVDSVVAAKLGILESVDSPPSDFQPDSQLAPEVRAGLYLQAVRQYGSPADLESEVLHGDRAKKQAADVELRLLGGLELKPLSRWPKKISSLPKGTGHLVVTGSSGSSVTKHGFCFVLHPKNGAEGALELDIPSSSVLMRSESAKVEVFVRRYQDDYAAVPSAGTLGANSSAELELPRGRWVEPWHVRLITSAGVRVCPGV